MENLQDVFNIKSKIYNGINIIQEGEECEHSTSLDAYRDVTATFA